jgi:hypothetical protein
MMNWIPIYIVGKQGFGKPVLRALEHSGLEYMQGYLYDNNLATEHSMFWISDRTPLRDLKKAVGADLIWKYRLYFFNDLKAFMDAAEPVEDSFTTAA